MFGVRALFRDSPRYSLETHLTIRPSRRRFAGRLEYSVSQMESKQIAIGVVTSDPATTMPIGGSVHIAPVCVSYDGHASPGWLQDWSSFNGILLSICFSDVEAHRIEGSAVMVAPGIAICARHVVDPALPFIMSGAHSITCFAITKAGLRIWRVRKITMVDASDLAILGLELASHFSNGETLFLSTVTTRLPKEGEELLLCGFRAASTIFPRHETKFSGQVIVSKGRAKARYPSGRDRVMMPWPCVEVSCASWGGMSGGPVYDAQGMLIGVLSSSVTGEDNDGPSFVSLIWPALVAQFEGGWPEPVFRNPTRLVDLDARLCAIDRRNAVEYKVDEQTGTQLTEYHVWE